MIRPHIYKTILLVDTDHHKKGEVYIGQAKLKSDWYLGGGKLVKTICKKWGKEVFKKEVIVEGEFNQYLLDDLERHYIRLYNSDNVGLNIEQGGKRGRSTPKKVYMYSLEGDYIKEFESTQKAAEELGSKNHRSICNACTCAGVTAFGHEWRYEKWENGLKESPERVRKGRSKTVHMYNMEGEYIESYENCFDAIRKNALSTKPNSITKSANKEGYPIKEGFRFTYTKIEKLEPLPDNLKIVWGGNEARKIKSIFQYDLEGNFLYKHSSLVDAALFIGKGGKHKTIGRALNKNGSSFGYKWKTTLD